MLDASLDKFLIVQQQWQFILLGSELKCLARASTPPASMIAFLFFGQADKTGRLR
jgi:hypothetical protein